MLYIDKYFGGVNYSYKIYFVYHSAPKFVLRLSIKKNINAFALSIHRKFETWNVWLHKQPRFVLLIRVNNLYFINLNEVYPKKNFPTMEHIFNFRFRSNKSISRIHASTKEKKKKKKLIANHQWIIQKNRCFETIPHEWSLSIPIYIRK